MKWILATLAVAIVTVGIWYLFLKPAVTVTTTTTTQPTAIATTTTTPETLTMQYCKTLGSGRERDLCKKDLAIQDNNETICEEIIIYDAKLFCNAYFSGNASLCEKIKEDSVREECIEEVK